MGPEEQPSHLRRSCYYDWGGTELEVHEFAVGLGEFVKRMVRERANEVKVADERPWSRTWWEVFPAMGVV